MPFSVTHQALGGLLRRHNAHVAEQATVDGVRIVEIDRLADEVRAIVKQKIEAALVAAGVECPDELIVLLLGGIDTEGIDGPVVSGADELYPIASGRAAAIGIGRYVFKICTPVGVSQSRYVVERSRSMEPHPAGPRRKDTATRERPASRNRKRDDNG